VWGDRSFALLAVAAVRSHKGGIVCTPVSTSSVVDDVVQKAGGKVVTTVVGAPKVAREMLATKAILGGEENGGVLFPEFQHCRDSGMTAARMVELLAKEGKPLSELIAALPKYALVKQKVKVPDAKKNAVMGALVEEVKGGKEKAKKVDTRDGVKIYTDDGWVLIRKSGTEPFVRVFAESKDEAKARALVQRFTKRVEEFAARA
jgi:phosphomannomutase/phosphoglucomutase